MRVMLVMRAMRGYARLCAVMRGYARLYAVLGFATVRRCCWAASLIRFRFHRRPQIMPKCISNAK